MRRLLCLALAVAAVPVVAPASEPACNMAMTRPKAPAVAPLDCCETRDCPMMRNTHREASAILPAPTDGAPGAAAAAALPARAAARGAGPSWRGHAPSAQISASPPLLSPPLRI